MKALSLDEFITRARKIHGDKYDYSEVKYKNSYTKVTIICKEHGRFQQMPSCHIGRGSGCAKCAKVHKYTTEEFIDKCKEAHGNKYEYSKLSYTGIYGYVTIICPDHGEFKQTALHHLHEKRGCAICTDYRRNNTESFIKNAVKIHGNKYNYTAVDYKHCNKHIKIICKKHGVFLQTPSHHLSGNGCVKCKTLDGNEFINRSKALHGDKYDYSKVKYKNSYTKVKIICPKHGLFYQTPMLHMSKSGCPSCQESNGERLVARYLDTHKIRYEREYTFDDCIYRKKLRFDFFLNDFNTVIEYDGKQHYKPYSKFGGDKCLELTKVKDKIKNDYCQRNKIKMIRIPYYKNINKALNDNLVFN